MPLIVEDGTGRADAESYISASDADTYHSDRGNAAWTGSSPVKEAALRKATEFMEQSYRLRWKSFRVTATQLLSWPRAWVPLPDAPYGYGSGSAFVPNNVVPTEVKRACAELALQALSGDLNPALTRPTVREAVGPIDVTYDTHGPERKRFPQIDMMLTAYLTGSGASVGLVRT